MKKLIVVVVLLGMAGAVGAQVRGGKEHRKVVVNSQPGLVRTMGHDCVAVGKTVGHGVVTFGKQMKRIFF